MNGDTHSFLVRIWHEALDQRGNITAWRGSIEHIGEGPRVYFVDMRQVIDYIQRQIGLERQDKTPAADQDPEQV